MTRCLDKRGTAEEATWSETFLILGFVAYTYNIQSNNLESHAVFKQGAYFMSVHKEGPDDIV